MSTPKPVFWRRGKPSKELDIALLRPPTLDKAERFETVDSVHKESVRSQGVLATAGESVLAEILDDCRSGAYFCNKTFCPACARTFRRWFIGQMLGHVPKGRRTHVVTVLLETVKRGELNQLQANSHRELLRKRLRASFRPDVAVMGCVEVVYKAKTHSWIHHVNLLVMGSTKAERKTFKSHWKKSPIPKAIQRVKLKHPAKQVSYVPKFTTYHRPGKQTGPKKKKAKPLNPREHVELVRWMDLHRFEDFMLLHNCRRQGEAIV